MTPPAAGSTLVIALLLMWTHLPAADTVASTASQTVELAPQQPQTPPATLVGNDGAAMLLVPAGEFIMGSDADEIVRLAIQQELVEGEIPRHRVYLDLFYIDQYEVTNAHFQQFVHATGYRTQAEREDWGWVDTGEEWGQVTGATWRAPLGPGSSIAELGQHPVVQVSQADAKAYCAWAGKRLPTEAEWEKAARGTDGRSYPWGEQFEGTRLNFCDAHCPRSWHDPTANDGYRYTAPVGHYAGDKSPYGAYDMAGNVREWVADWYDENYYKHSPTRNPSGPAAGEQAVLRGGGGSIPPATCACPSAPASSPRSGTATSVSGARRRGNQGCAVGRVPPAYGSIPEAYLGAVWSVTS